MLQRGFELGLQYQTKATMAVAGRKIEIIVKDEMVGPVVEAIVRHSRGEPTEREVLIPTALYRRADAENDPSLATDGGGS